MDQAIWKQCSAVFFFLLICCCCYFSLCLSFCENCTCLNVKNNNFTFTTDRTMLQINNCNIYIHIVWRNSFSFTVLYCQCFCFFFAIEARVWWYDSIIAHNDHLLWINGFWIDHWLSRILNPFYFSKKKYEH